MSRYNNSTSIKDTNGIRKQSTVIIPTPTQSTEDAIIQTTSIERLDLLAYKFYGDASLWYVIASANGLGKGSLIIPTNSRLRIPDVTYIQEQIQTINLSR
jgi:phage tail protein X